MLGKKNSRIGKADLSAHQAAEPQELLRFPNSSNSSLHNLIIPQLRLFVAAGDQDLRTGMIKWHEQSAIPVTNPAPVILQIELMIVKQFQRLERNCPQGHYNVGLDQLNSSTQKW